MIVPVRLTVTRQKECPLISLFILLSIVVGSNTLCNRKIIEFEHFCVLDHTHTERGLNSIFRSVKSKNSTGNGKSVEMS